MAGLWVLSAVGGVVDVGGVGMDEQAGEKIKWNEGSEGWLWTTQGPDGKTVIGRAETKAEAFRLIEEAQTPKPDFVFKGPRSPWGMPLGVQ